MLGALVQPSAALFALFALALVLWLMPVNWLSVAGGRLLALGAVAYVLFAFSPLPRIMMLPLEQRFPQPPASASLARVDGIVVLGGAIESRLTRARKIPVLNDAGERATVGAALARQYPNARMMISNGGNHRTGTGPYDYAEYLLYEGLGVPREQILFEHRSSDTYENATMGFETAQPEPGQVWLLVTSAGHMARAVGSFRKAGFNVVPWPVDYRTAGWQDATLFFHRPSEGLAMTDAAVSEWLGLVYYWWLGRTSALFPGPQ